MDERLRRTEAARSDVKAILILEHTLGWLCYVVLVTHINQIAGVLTNISNRVWIPPGRNPFLTSLSVFSDHTILSLTDGSLHSLIR